MSKHTFLVLSLLGVGLLAPMLPTHAKPPVITKEDKGKEITVKPGETFTLKLPANPTTGYLWYYLDGPAPFKAVGRKYARTPASPDLKGVGGTETFTFKATGVGAGYLRLYYIRPFEAEVAPDALWQVKINVAK